MNSEQNMDSDIVNQCIYDHVKRNKSEELNNVLNRIMGISWKSEEIILVTDLIVLIGLEAFNNEIKPLVSEEMLDKIQAFVGNLTDDEKRYVDLVFTNYRLVDIGNFLLSEAIVFYIEFFRNRSNSDGNLVLQRSVVDEVKQ